MHVLHILNSAHGGSAISTFELIEELKNHGVQSSLVCFSNADADQTERISNLVESRVLFIPLYWMNKRIRAMKWKRPLIEAKSLWDTWGGHRYQSSIDLLIRKNSVNMVHTSTILNPEGAIAAKRNNIPHVWHVRELIGPSKHFQFYNYDRWSKFVQTHCEYLIANSRATEHCLKEYFSPGKIVLIPNGIDGDKYEIREHTNKNRPLVVGMVGSVTTRWKNHEYFIKISASFKTHPDVLFRIYGSLPSIEDSYFSGLRILVKELGCENVIQFVDFKRSPEIMKEVDVLFHPCPFESFGRIFVEAMASGIPIVAVREGGALELVQEDVNGFLIRNGDVEDAHHKLCLLLGDADLRSRMGKQGRRIMNESFTLARLGDRMSTLYASINEHYQSGI